MHQRIVAAYALCLLLVAVGVAFSQSVSVEIAVAPSTFVLGLDQGGAVTVHADIPFSQVDPDPVLITLNGTAADSIWADDRGDLVARFSEVAVEAALSVGPQTLTLEGPKADGALFTGSDTVQVIEWRRRR